MSCGVQGEFLEDVVQTAWALVIEELQRFDCDPSKGSFRAWLFARVRNVTVNQVRDLARNREHTVGVHFAEQESQELDPSQLFERQWDELILHDALRVLERYVSDFDYKLFVMRRFHELSVAELVEDTGVAEATIRSKLHRTMTTFRKLIDVQGYRDLMFQCD
jgi:RNA polymerase sigma-70 factor (ECF subfamily)